MALSAMILLRNLFNCLERFLGGMGSPFSQGFPRPYEAILYSFWSAAFLMRFRPSLE